MKTPAESPTQDITVRLKVLIVDDHPAMRMGLRSVVGSQDDMVAIADAANGQEAVDLCRLHNPDVVLMDLRMPNGSGFDAIKRIRAAQAQTRVIVLTTYDLDEDVFNALQQGASAYLLKDCSMPTILSTIRKVSSGEVIIPEQLGKRLGKRLRREELTQRELEILDLIVRGNSNKEIAFALMIAEDTVKSHLKTVFAKLGVKARTEAAITAVRLGIIHLD